MKPGEVIPAPDPVPINEGKERVEIDVQNTSLRTVFVSSHYPFFEVNKRLRFDRAKAWGMRLDIPAGDCVRWKPGETVRVRLVPFGGERIVKGFNSLTNGRASRDRLAGAMERTRQQGFGETPETR